MNKGIVLLAFGRRGYLNMAHNLAMSIKFYNPAINITLFTENNYDPIDKDLYDSVRELPNDMIYTAGVGIDPIKAKIGLYDILPYEYNLYLDVDALLLKDITPLLDTLIENKETFVTDIIDTGDINKSIQYSIWAKNEDIFKHFDLPKDAILPSTQTSWMYIKKCKDSKQIFETAKKYIDFPKNRLTKKWGGTMPDELIFSGVLAKLKCIPKLNPNPIFFGNKLSEKTYTELREQYFILSLYGNGRGRTMTLKKYIDWYDSLLKTYGNKYYYSKTFMQDKHVGNG